MVKINVQGVDFDVKNLHDMDVLSFFPDGEGHINGVVETLSHAFDDDRFSPMLEKMTVEEMLSLWEEWSSKSNVEFVYKRVEDAMMQQRAPARKALWWFLGSWILLAVASIVLLTLLLV
jgi:hypothetical protein